MPRRRRGREGKGQVVPKYLRISEVNVQIVPKYLRISEGTAQVESMAGGGGKIAKLDIGMQVQVRKLALETLNPEP